MNPIHTKRKLGFWMLTALVTGNMIGSGIFVVPSALASFGSIGLVAWLFTAFGSIILALVFARLGHYLPLLGGPYAYCREGFGEVIGFVVAYGYYLAVCTGNAAVVVAIMSYLTIFFPNLTHMPWHEYLVGLAFLWGFTTINILGVRSAGWVQLTTTILKIIPLVLIAVFGSFHLNLKELHQFNISSESNLFAFTAAATITLWSFIGLESASVPADDVEDPKRNIPRATIWGTVITTIVYIGSAVAVMGTIPFNVLAHSPAPYADTAALLFGSWGADFVSIGALISCIGTLNGWILLQGQLPMAAANDKLFPTFFSRKNKRGSPYIGLIVSAILVSILLALTVNPDLVKQFTFVIKLATLGTLIPYLLTSLSIIILYKKFPEKFKTTKFVVCVVLGLLGFIYSYWMMIGAGFEVIALGSMLLFSGFPLYIWAQQCHSDKKLT